MIKYTLDLGKYFLLLNVVKNVVLLSNKQQGTYYIFQWADTATFGKRTNIFSVTLIAAKLYF